MCTKAVQLLLKIFLYIECNQGVVAKMKKQQQQQHLLLLTILELTIKLIT